MSNDLYLKRLDTFARQHGLREKSARSFGSRESTTTYCDAGYSVIGAFIDFGATFALDVAREELIGGVPFRITIAVAEFARVYGDKKAWREDDAQFQIRVLESRTPEWFAGNHSMEARMHRNVRPASTSL